MGTVLQFKADSRDRLADDASASGVCEIVIFPGVRIERAAGATEPDEYRPVPGSKLDGTNGRRRPRKSS
jgi:hypothetical protein